MNHVIDVIDEIAKRYTLKYPIELADSLYQVTPGSLWSIQSQYISLGQVYE